MRLICSCRWSLLQRALLVHGGFLSCKSNVIRNLLLSLFREGKQRWMMYIRIISFQRFKAALAVCCADLSFAGIHFIFLDLSGPIWCIAFILGSLYISSPIFCLLMGIRIYRCHQMRLYVVTLKSYKKPSLVLSA